MMKKMKYWICNRFLPVWAKEQLLRENEQLQQELQKKDTEIQRLRSYIAGLEAGIKNQRRIVIFAGGEKK